MIYSIRLFWESYFKRKGQLSVHVHIQVYPVGNSKVCSFGADKTCYKGVVLNISLPAVIEVQCALRCKDSLVR